jgi:signal transduction histidine kinase
VKKNIIISRNIEEKVIVLADKNYVEQVLENLVSNAIKFSPFERTVFINLTSQNGKAISEVKDQGPGLSEDDKKKLFGKYQKLSAKPTGNEISTGLGLSIVKKFVEAMNGAIWCESELGKGASFFVEFKKN